MRFEKFFFGLIRIDGVTYEYDVVIDRGEIRKRKKKPSKQFRNAFGHTPLTIEENIPWRCHRLVIGMGAHGALPVMDEVKREAEWRKVEGSLEVVGLKREFGLRKKSMQVCFSHWHTRMSTGGGSMNNQEKRVPVRDEELALSDAMTLNALVESLEEKGVVAKQEILDRIRRLQEQTRKPN
jgi:hypothetical protein